MFETICRLRIKSKGRSIEVPVTIPRLSLAGNVEVVTPNLVKLPINEMSQQQREISYNTARRIMKILFVADGRSPIAQNWIRHFAERGDKRSSPVDKRSSPVDRRSSLRIKDG